MMSNDTKMLPPRPEARLQVQALQAKFYERALEDPSKVFDGIYNLVHHPAVLVEAAVRVLSNKGANTPGVDGNKKSIVNERGTEDFVLEIHKELKTRKYSPTHLRPVDIPKSNGTTRHLKIPTLADRVAQKALTIVLEPIFEADFLPCSHAYRTGTFWDIPWGCHTAIFATRQGIEENRAFTHVVDADIVGCFDNIDHDLLLRRLRLRVKDKEVLELIGRFLRAGTAYGGDIKRTTKGTPQGGCLSPFLCNVVLTVLDEGVSLGGARNSPPPSTMLTSAPLGYERYADDFIVLTQDKTTAEATKDHLEEFLRDNLKMDLSKAKTHITEVHEGFDFLGHRIWRDPSSASCRLAPTQKKMTELVEDLTALVRDEKDPDARNIRARDRVRGFIDHYMLLAESEMKPLLDLIEDTLHHLGLRPNDDQRTA